jgi:alkanesulfonate monooxygenase SsuD/methylene tetrahydromethanopterin reductase-like flavin-dependent oxidoreductase (luciferase family)
MATILVVTTPGSRSVGWGPDPPLPSGWWYVGPGRAGASRHDQWSGPHAAHAAALDVLRRYYDRLTVHHRIGGYQMPDRWSEREPLAEPSP